jgi:hypothetical protein
MHMGLCCIACKSARLQCSPGCLLDVSLYDCVTIVIGVISVTGVTSVTSVLCHNTNKSLWWP